jgi:hypothetical protein
MIFSVRRRRYLYPVKRRVATIMGIVLVPTRPLKCVVSRTMHRAPVIQTVKQTIQLFRERYRDVTTVQLSTRVADSSICIEHIINPVRHRVKLIRRLKIEGNVKLVSGT